MEEELFASKPRSYRMDRKSAEAIKLRDAVNRKLFDFLGNYTDDVLAEYIVVLVCNGKSQNQARNDLEAFLGEDSGTFVTWLWNHLAKENYISRTLDASNLKADITSSYDILNKEQKSGTMPSLHILSTRKSDIQLPESGMYDRPYCSTNCDGSNITEIPESLQRWCPSMNGYFTEGMNERLKDHLNEVSPKRLANEHSGAANSTGATKQFSSIVRCAPENLTDDEQLYYQYQDQKIPKTDSSALLHQPLPSPRTEQPRRGLRSTLTENHQPRPLHVRNSAKIRLQSAAVDSVRHQITRPRGNVWDRLGKACNEDDAEMREKSNLHNSNLSRRDLPDSQAEENQNPRSMWIKQNARVSSNLVRESVGADNSCHKAMSEDSPNKCRKLESSPNSRRKRLYSEFVSGNSSASSVRKENHVKIKEVPPKMENSFQVKYNRSLSKLPSEAKRSTTLVSDSAQNSVIRARAQHYSQAIKVDPVISASVVQNSQTDSASSLQINKSASVTRQTKKPVPKNIQLPSNSESPCKAECPTANCKPIKDQDQVVNATLRQMETKLVELRKQAALTGVQNHSEEDLESRTVLVTNILTAVM
ncbi:uncharacterized protein LOC109843115 isoform X2 [Asparagus officinalis]|uniref:uncharacterized protein LOC109843115 isoform X2 n=1 Tax=Asparagus officinalis TaxID=4686 RepID=UPI00098DFD80|nr:uncharacterized protein LOC109843115 isoform X2 [Asparagus officinalis]